MDGGRSKRGNYWLEASTWQNGIQKEKTRADAEEMVSFWSVLLKFTHKKRFHKVYYYLPVTELC